jgi:hypothetical protein
MFCFYSVAKFIFKIIMLQTVMATTPTPPNTRPSSSNGQSIASSAKQLFKPTDMTDIG